MDLDQSKKVWEKTVENVDWDSVIERRVMMNLLSFRRESRPVLSRSRLITVAAIAALVAIVIVVFFTLGKESDKTPTAEKTYSKAPSNNVSETGFSTMRFADGSKAIYITTSDVEVEEQSSSVIRLWHKQGKVRYDVKEGLERAFVVNAGGVEVKVVGTIFVVEVEDPGVTVKVEKGVVTVDNGSGVMELLAGEEISLWGCRESDSDTWLLPGVSSEDGGISEIEQGDVTVKSNEPSFAQLMREVDRARNRGDNELAAKILNKIVIHYSSDGRVVSVLFTLGKVESKRGRHEQAARAFRKCWKRSPNGTLAEDAHFQEAVSWKRVGKMKEAGEAARRYLDKYPDGPYVDRMSIILR